MHFQTPDVDKQREGDSGFWEEQEDGRRFSLCAWLYFTIFGAYNCKIHGNMTKGEFLEEYKDCAERKVLEKIWEVKQKGETDLDISKAGITDLRVLMILNNLKDLDVSFTQVEDLSPLSALMHLTFLDVSSTKINDLRPLSTLMHLTFLNISSTQVNDLRPLSTLTNLTWFNISSTQVNDLRPLSTLTNLIWLKASHTLVKDMKPIIHLIEKGLPVIYGVDIINYAIFIENCPLVHPPVEIAKQGNEAILRYFRERERTGTIKLMEARLLLVGQGASGKTTLRRKLLDVNADMPEKGDTTRGIEVEPLEFNTPEGDDFTLQIWDFGGQNIQHYAHQFFLSDSSVYALLSNEREQNPNFQYWLNIIEMLGGDSPVLVVQNEIEGHYEPIKNKPAIRERFEHVQEFHAVDLSKAATDQRFDILKKDLCHYAGRLPHIGKEYPVSFVEVRKQLQALSETKRQYIPWPEFETLCRDQGITDELLIGDYARTFHILGICLHFAEDLDLSNFVFLRPKWIIDSLFDLLYHQVVIDGKGEFSKEDLRTVWTKTEHKGMHGNLLHLMENFELCYPIEGTSRFIVPQRLPAHDDGERWSEPDATRVLYRYKFMPKGMLTRLTCRLHRKIEGENVWSDAVIFTDSGARVFAREVYSENTIEINATGARKNDLLNIVVDQLDDIHEKSNFANLRVDKLVPCPCPECEWLAKRGEEPHFYKYAVLVNRLAKGKLDVDCEKPEANEVSIMKVMRLTGIRFQTKPLLKKLFASGRIDKVLQLMREWSPNNPEVMAQMARLEVLEKEERTGKTDTETYLRERSRILNGVLKTLEKL